MSTTRGPLLKSLSWEQRFGFSLMSSAVCDAYDSPLLEKRFAVIEPCLSSQGAVEIIFRNKNVEQETANYIEKFANPLIAAQRGLPSELVGPEYHYTPDRVR